MNKRAVLLVTLGVVILAVASPIVTAIYIANRQAVNAETDRALAYANDAVRRSDMTADQMAAGIGELLAAQGNDPCSPTNVALMRRIDVASSYIQSIGHIVGDRIVCSSIDTIGSFDVGPVDIVQPSGVKLRVNVELPFARGTTFLVVEQNGYAAIIHKNLPIDVTVGDGDEVALAVVTEPGAHVLTSHGVIRPEWVAKLAGNSQTTFIDADSIVAAVSSPTHFIGAVAALPTLQLRQRVWATALFVVPIGVIAGVVLALAVLYLGRSQLAMPAVIRSALRHNEFFLVYQPIVDLSTGVWVGAEALIRWRRDGGEEIRPDLFIQVAEDSGLIKQVTARVVELIGRDAAGFFRRRPDFHLALNLSPADLEDEKTVDLIKGLMRSTGASAGNLTVEATERRLIDPEASRRIFHELRAAGIRIAIDDFGTGYSSLSYLESLEVDCLKIDKSFVDTLGTRAATSYVVPHIIEMGKSLNLTLVAEGVETEDQAKILRARGVQLAQGWYFARPMLFAEMVDQMNRAARDRKASLPPRRNEPREMAVG
jgi:sensor c-di-GMP phosphodiesterase-like protein